MSKFNVGDKVTLRTSDALVDHARSVPPSAGYTKEGFKWREILNSLKGKVGEVTMTFSSDHVNVTFEGDNTIGIDSKYLRVAKERPEIEVEPKIREIIEVGLKKADTVEKDELKLLLKKLDRVNCIHEGDLLNFIKLAKRTCLSQDLISEITVLEKYLED